LGTLALTAVIVMVFASGAPSVTYNSASGRASIQSPGNIICAPGINCPTTELTIPETLELTSLTTNTLCAGICLPTPTSTSLEAAGIAYDSGMKETYTAVNWVTAKGVASSAVIVRLESSGAIVASVTVGKGNLQSVVYDSGMGYIFVATGTGNSVAVICDSATSCDTSVSGIAANSVMKTFTGLSNPKFMAYDTGKNQVVVTNSGGKTVTFLCDGHGGSAVPPNTVTSCTTITLAAGDEPMGVAYDTSNGRIWVGNDGPQTITVYQNSATSNTPTLAQTITTTLFKPFAIVFDSGVNEMFVSNADTGMNVYSATSYALLAEPSVNGATYMSFFAGTHFVFISQSEGSSGCVSLINDQSFTVSSSASIGAGSSFETYDPATNYVYVSNSAQGTVSWVQWVTPD